MNVPPGDGVSDTRQNKSFAELNVPEGTSAVDQRLMIDLTPVD